MIGTTSRRLALVVAAVATIGCDRVTKHAASLILAGTADRSYLADLIRLGYAENTGGFLSIGANLPPLARTVFFTVATGLMLVGLVAFAIRRKWDGLATLGLTLFIAGAASNWIDRLARGSVIDFLNIGVGSVRTGIFNVADVAIMVGAGLFLFTELRRGKPPSDQKLSHEGNGATGGS
jgi:signal peptidase II